MTREAAIDTTLKYIEANGTSTYLAIKELWDTLGFSKADMVELAQAGFGQEVNQASRSLRGREFIEEAAQFKDSKPVPQVKLDVRQPKVQIQKLTLVVKVMDMVLGSVDSNGKKKKLGDWTEKDCLYNLHRIESVQRGTMRYQSFYKHLADSVHKAKVAKVRNLPVKEQEKIALMYKTLQKRKELEVPLLEEAV